MIKRLLLIIFFIPIIAKSQSILAKRYVDDRINEKTYLYFKPGGTFEFSYLYDLMGDEAIGHYKQHNDTIFLTYKDTSFTGSQFFEHPGNVRADSLIIKGHKLYKIKNGVSYEFDPQEIVYKKPPKNWHYKRKYLIFGPWHSNYSKYYMIDERYAKWATKKWLNNHKDLFQ